MPSFRAEEAIVISLRSRLELKQISKSILLLRTNLFRRFVFGGIALLLLVTLFVSIQVPEDFQAGRLAGTIIYLCIVIAVSAVALYSKDYVFNAVKKQLELWRHVLMLDLQSPEYISFERIKGVTLLKVKLIAEESLKRKDGSKSLLGNVMEKRKVLYKLHLDLEDKRLLLEEGTYPEELVEIGETIADFLGLSFREEDI